MIYVLTPFSLYLIRIDKEQVSDVYLSSAAKAISTNFKVDPNKQLLISQQSNIERSTPFDYSHFELNLDASRVISIGGNRLLLSLSNGKLSVLQFKYD